MKQEVEPVHGALSTWGAVGSFFGFLKFPQKEQTMNCVCIDLHEKMIRIGVVDKDRTALKRKRSWESRKNKLNGVDCDGTVEKDVPRVHTFTLGMRGS